MKVGFLCSHNPYNRNSFSGTPFYMRRALEAAEGLEIRVLGGHRPPAKTRIGRALIRKTGLTELSVPPESLQGLDFIIAPVGCQAIQFLPQSISIPLVIVTDATPGFLRDFYGWDIPETLDAQEIAALRRSALVIYSSHFMRDRAMQEFAQIDLPPLAVQPFGLNLEALPATVTKKPAINPLKLVYIGQDWRRKGGDIAVEAAALLRSRERPVQLTCIGARPDQGNLPNWVEHLGYLDKNKPAEAQAFERALAEAHVFVLPTRADCTPMVVAEANAFGCPVVIRDIGGIRSLMDPPRNGVLVPEEGDARAFANAIESITSDPLAYQTRSISSYEHCRDNLTWEAWADGVISHLTGLIEKRETI